MQYTFPSTDSPWMFNVAQRLLLLWFWDTGCEASTKAEAGCPTELPGVGVHKSRGRMPYRASRSRGAQRQLCHLQSNCQGPRSQDAPSSPGDKDVRGPPRRYIKSLSFLSLSTVIPTAFQVVGCYGGQKGKLWEASWECKLENSVWTSHTVRCVWDYSWDACAHSQVERWWPSVWSPA